MEKVYQAVAAGFGAVIGFFCGMPPLMWILLGAMTLDYVTGIMCGFAGCSLKTENGGLSSTAAREGLMRKAMIILIVFLAVLLDLAVQTGAGVEFAAVTGATCLWFIASEGISIVENAEKLGVPIPKFLKKALEIMQDKGESETNAD